MPVVVAILVVVIGFVLIFSVVWLWQLRTENAGMVDPVWAASLGAAALFIGACGTGAMVNRVCVAAGGAVWGARLARHLWRRNRGKPEDTRYRAFRERWGAQAARNMFGFFLLQAVISMLLSIAFLVPAYARRCGAPAGWVAGFVVDLDVVVAGEALADRQLSDFNADPAQSRESVPRRFVALFAASELLLRMRALGRVCRAVDRHCRGAGRCSCRPC